MKVNEELHIIPGLTRPFEPVGQGKPVAGRKPVGPTFAEVLDRQSREVQFSRHAQQRMTSRGIKLNGEDLARLDKAIADAGAKGGRDALVMLDDKALVVSVKNQTVVTVVDRESLKGNVFTNIDSAIIA